LAYSYTGIGGESENRFDCPLLIVKIDLVTKNQIKYSLLFPIEFAICGNSQINDIKVLEIDLNELLM
jgi:hypothetical protein